MAGALILRDRNIADSFALEIGGGINLVNVDVTILRSAILDHKGYVQDGIDLDGSSLFLGDSTIAGNTVLGDHAMAQGEGIGSTGLVMLRDSMITGNLAKDPAFGGEGCGIWSMGVLDVGNSIIAGNGVAGRGSTDHDVAGTILLSNGHNLFGSDVAGNVAGDWENVAASAVFAEIDPATGGGRPNLDDGVVLLLDSLSNLAISAGPPLGADPDRQGHAPYPAGEAASRPLSRTRSRERIVGGPSAHSAHSSLSRAWASVASTSSGACHRPA